MIQLKNLFILTLLLCCFAGVQPIYADVNPDTATTGVKQSGVIDDALAGWLWFGMSSISDPVATGGTVHAGGPSSRCTYVFQGSSVEVFASTGPWVTVDGRNHRLGSLKIAIDGRQVGLVNLKAQTSESSASVGRFDGLSDTNHVIELSGDGGWITVDYINVGSNRADQGEVFPLRGEMQLNGTAAIRADQLILIDGPKQYQTSSAFFTKPVRVRKFKCNFSFQLIRAVGDGIGFVIQSASPTALGATGEGLGYRGIGRSLCIKYDIFDNAGEGTDSTGLYLNGYSPTVPAIDLSSTPIILSSGHPIDVSIDYDGSVMHVSETDTFTGGTATQKYPIDISSIVGDTAYIGFTASDGDKTGTFVILSWAYSTGGS